MKYMITKGREGEEGEIEGGRGWRDRGRGRMERKSYSSGMEEAVHEVIEVVL